MSGEILTSPSEGIVLTGPLGSGKSTVANLLAGRYGFRRMQSVTTRPVAPTEAAETIGIDRAAFVSGVQAGALVLPISFGHEWYAYKQEDWSRALLAGGAGYIFNVRPYLALALGSVLPQVETFWLGAPKHELAMRRSLRGAERDQNARRLAQDEDDAVYEPLFANVVRGTEPLAVINELAKRLAL